MLSLMTLSVFALVVPSLLAPVDPIDQDGEAVYRLAIDADAPRLLHVEAELPCGDHAFSIGESHTQPSDKRWSDYVERLQITTLDGAVVAWKQTGANRWVVDSLAPARLRLRYDVRLEHDGVEWPPSTAESTFVRPDCIFFRAYAVLISTRQVPAARIHFDLPDDWKITTPLAAVEGDTRARYADTRDQAYNIGVMLGTHATSRITVGDVELDLGVSSDLPDAIETMVPAFRTALGEAANIFGGTPKSRYGILAARDPNPWNSSGSGFDNGMSILLGQNPPDDKGGVWAMVLVHELVHMWLGGAIANRRSFDEEWFKEGMTEYLTIVIAGRTGIIREDVRLSTLGRHWHGYLTSAGDRSLADAGRQKSRYYGLIYGGGVYVSMLMDLEIRRATDGKRTIDDLMQALNAEFGIPRKNMTSYDLGRVASAVAGTDLTWILENFVRGDSILTSELVLTPLGLMETEGRRSPLIRDPNASDQAKAFRESMLGLD